MKSIISLIISAGIILSSSISYSSTNYRDEFSSFNEPSYDWNNPESICVYDIDSNQLLMCNIESMEIKDNDILFTSESNNIKVNKNSNYYISNNQIEFHVINDKWVFRIHGDKVWKLIPRCDN